MSAANNPGVEVNMVKDLSFDDHDWYLRSYQLFARGSAKYQVQKNWVDKVFKNAVVDKLQVDIPDGEDFRALGVGSGSGEMESAMTSKLVARFPRISNCVVEPAESQIIQYQDLVKKMGVDLKGITFDWQKLGLEQFRKTHIESEEKHKFHFISAIHSLYHLEDWEDSLRWLFDQLVDGGMLLVIMLSDDSGISRVWDRFVHRRDSNLNGKINSGHIRDVFVKNKIAFISFKQPSPLDITKCFKNGNELNKDGKLIVDFMMQTVNFDQTASPELLNDLVAYLCGSECSERKNGKILFNYDWDAIIAMK